MKATIDIPDQLYRRVKAKSALDRRPVREVTIHLFQEWLGDTAPLRVEEPAAAGVRPLPTWFGRAKEYARQVQRHDMASIRASIATGRVHNGRQPKEERATR